MLTQIGVEFGASSELIVPVLGVSPKDSLLVRKITGLDPPDISLFVGDYARDGGIYQGRRVGNRNVVTIFDLNPNPALGETVPGLRELLYKTFVDPLVNADYVKMNLYDDLGRVRYVVGYTEKFETDIFDADSFVQISMICPDPYLRDDVKTVHSHPSGWLTYPFTYSGTAETGFEVEIAITSTTNVVTLDLNGQTMVINRASIAGDVIRINTTRGSRSLTVEQSSAPGVETPIVSYLSPLSPWLELHSDANVIKVYGATSANSIGAIRELQFYNSYWGI